MKSNLIIVFSSCSHDNLPTKNTTANIKDPEKLDMIYATKDLDGEGRLYEVNYTVDYKLDEVIKAQKTSSEALFAYIIVSTLSCLIFTKFILS